MTTHELSKKLKLLDTKKVQLMEKLRKDSEYTFANSERDNPNIPDFNLSEVVGEIGRLNTEIAEIKHIINVSNSTNTIEGMTIDTILIRLSMLNQLKDTYSRLANRNKTERVRNSYGNVREPEYSVANYEIDDAKKLYSEVQEEIVNLQILLDKYNTTVEVS